MDGKKILIETLDFFKYKLDNNLCTPSEIESVARAVQENVDMSATIQDIAKFYGKPELNVRVAINRRLIEKPRRNVVLYPFQKVQQVVPEKWHKERTSFTNCE